MTRILIVDDDPGQLRMLARVVSMRRRDLTVLTASHGAEAVEVLESGPIDFVLTDLQMPEMNGFELLAWVSRNQPHVPVYSMTAYPDADAVGRLSELGSVECFTKPVDVPVLLQHVSQVLAEGTRGHVRNIGLPSFLQLLEMERKTCTLTIESYGRVGYLYLRQGRMVHARTGEMLGEDAAMEVIGWEDSAITIQSSCTVREETIETPLGFLIMDALRQRDETTRDREVPKEVIEELKAKAAPTEAAPEEPEPPSSVDASQPRPAVATPAAPLPRRRLRSSVSTFPVYLPADARAIAIVERESGRVRNAAGKLDTMDAHAQLVATLFEVQCRAIDALALADPVREVVFTTPRLWTVVRPLSDPTSLVMLVFDPERANLVMERMALDGFVSDVDGWCAKQAT